jgi:DNA-nicking Smr family endonuclease
MNNRQTNSGILELDIHGMTKYQAKISIDSMLKKANSGVYGIRIIHGYHNGTELKSMVMKEYRTNRKVKRIEVGLNQGITDLVLREL